MSNYPIRFGDANSDAVAQATAAIEAAYAQQPPANAGIQAFIQKNPGIALGGGFLLLSLLLSAHSDRRR